jgi:ribosomal protein L22
MSTSDSETPEPETPDEATADSAADRSVEPEAAASDETTRSASEPDVSSSDAADESADVDASSDEAQEPEAADTDAPADEAQESEAAAVDEEAPAPKPRRRRRRAATESAGDETATAEPEVEPESGAAAEPEAAPGRPTRGAPSRRRSRRDPNLPAPVVRAQAKYVRSSARKARLVCDNIRGKSVDEARAILALTPRAIARDWSKLLESAVANAEHNHELVGEDLYVKSVKADEGPTIKRFRPRAMGRATRIRKRTSHLTIMLTPKD